MVTGAAASGNRCEACEYVEGEARHHQISGVKVEIGIIYDYYFFEYNFQLYDISNCNFEYDL